MASNVGNGSTSTASIYYKKKTKKPVPQKRDDNYDDDDDTDSGKLTELHPEGGEGGGGGDNKPKRKKYPRKMWIEKDDFDVLLQIVDTIYDVGTPRNFNLKLLYHILFWTGLRISEALLLSRNQIIDFIHGKSIQVVIPKTKTTRSLLNTNHIFEQLAYYRRPEVEAQIADVGLANSYGSALNFRRAQKWSFPCMFALQMHKFGKVDDPHKLIFSLHSFRASVINRLLRNQVALPDVSQIIGHKNISTTLVYMRSFPDIQRYNTMLNDVKF